MGKCLISRANFYCFVGRRKDGRILIPLHCTINNYSSRHHTPLDRNWQNSGKPHMDQNLPSSSTVGTQCPFIHDAKLVDSFPLGNTTRMDICSLYFSSSDTHSFISLIRYPVSRPIPQKNGFQRKFL